MSNSRGACNGYNCNCKAPYGVSHYARYDYCECRHTVLCHSRPEGAPDGPLADEISAPVVDTEPESKAVRTAPVTSERYSGSLTPAQARAILKSAGQKVGDRGRLSPEQMKLAESLK